MFEKLKNQLYHYIIGQSILITAGLCLLITGIFYNYSNSTLTDLQSIVFILALTFFACSLLFVFINIILCIRMNKINKRDESVNSQYTDYEPDTGLMYPEVFNKKVREYMLLSNNLACMVDFHAETIEQLYHTQLFADAHSQVYSLSSILIPGKQDTFISGFKSRHEYQVFIYDQDCDSILEMIDSFHNKLKAELQRLIPTSTEQTIECGFTWYPEQGKTLNELNTNTSFALFEAICFNKAEKNEFTPSSYQKHQMDFKKNDRFEKLMENNSFRYFYQPIISAKTGDVYAYEALMRTEDYIGLTPTEILEIADRQNRLYEIEYNTFNNILKLFQQQFLNFHNKYLFINCLPNQLLTKEDFDSIYKKYNTLTQFLVVEASEIYVHTEEQHKILSERLHIMGSKLALDDYGSGYANELNLVKYNPKYIKIDRSLITNIDSDEKKRHLVSNIIQFAKLHGMISLAEGVETYKELYTVIFLGVDLLQGFYLHRPSPEILDVLSQKLRDEIADINLKYLKSQAGNNTYIVDKDAVVDMTTLDNGNYSKLIINTQELRIKGNADFQQSLNIVIPDNSELLLELDNINIKANTDPCIQIGRNSKITIALKGNNTFYGQGIKVPESSKLSMVGDGNLTITTITENSIGIGVDPSSAFGSIHIDIAGKLTIHNKKESSICIGGGKTTSHSKIKLLGGKYTLSSDGVNAIGVGCIEGEANIELGRISMYIEANGTNSIGIGSLNGCIELASSADLTMKLTGQKSCCIGALSDQKGNINLQEGTVKIKLNAQDGCAIGSLDGSIYIKIALKECICLIQGIAMCGIGNYTGSGITEIKKGTISIKMASGNKFYLGSQNGPLLINGGNINCPINRSVKPINRYRIPLRHYHFPNRNHFIEHVEIDNLAYDYEAYTTDYVSDINVYLPEFKEYEDFLCP